MRIEWLPRAHQNLQHQMLYVAEHSPRAADAIDESVEHAMRQLETYPASGRPGRVRGTRELVIPGTPFILIYRIEPKAVVILRLLHGAQKWPPRRKP